MLRYVAGVTTLWLDAERCDGCGMCTTVCPHAVFALSNGRAAVADRDACMECGACARNCPREAIHVRAGVGCATAVINGAIRGTESCCCG
jgi:NAD-dependent dihydropyrimidine dehydrogenase PreA subunit